MLWKQGIQAGRYAGSMILSAMLLAGCGVRHSNAPTTGSGSAGPSRLALVVSPRGDLLALDTVFGFNVVNDIPIGIQPTGVALAQGGREVVVTSAGDQTVRVFRRTTGARIGPGADAQIGAGGKPVAVAVGVNPSGVEEAYVITSDSGRLIGINTSPTALTQDFFIPIPMPATALGAAAVQPVLVKLALSLAPDTGRVRAVYITDSANNVVWQVTQPATGVPQVTPLAFPNPGAQTVPAHLNAIAVKATATQDQIFVTDANNANIYTAAVDLAGGVGTLSTGTTVNGAGVLNNDPNATGIHPAIVYRGDVNPPVGELYMAEEAIGLSTGQNVAVVAVKADLSDAGALKANSNVFNIQSARLRAAGVTAMALNKASDGTFQFFVLGASSGTITTIALDKTGLARAGGLPQTFPMGDNANLTGTDLVITTD